MRARRWLVLLGVLVLVAAGLVAFRWWSTARLSDLQQAVRLAPADAQRLSWTDWADVRRVVHARGGADATEAQLDTLLDRAYTRDLSSTSALLSSAPVLQEKFGFSPATLEWELFSQSDAGAVDIMRLPDDTDMDALADTLEQLGYQRPDDEEGVWRGGTDLLPGLGSGLTPELQYFALDADDHLVLSSDTPGYLGDAVAVATGDADHLTALDGVVEASGDALSAAIYTGDYTCAKLAMSQADRDDQDAADKLLQQAGEVSPMTGMAMAAQPGGGVRVALSFDSDDQARTNADSRSRLAAGPAPGQGGDFGDRFRLGRVRADGRLLTMELRPVEGQYVLSDLSNGPVLFLTC